MDLERVNEIVQQHGNDPSFLVQVLLAIQRENHWLPQEALRRVGEKLGAPMSRIRHIATFYKTFSLAPKGRHEVQVCMGTACHVRGAPRILDTVQDDLGIRPGETDPTLKFSLDTVNCLGCCALGPVLVVDGRTHGKLSPAKATEVLRGYE